MPHIPVHPSAEKRQRQNLKRRDRNRAIKTRVHSAVKDAVKAIEGADAAGAQQELRQATRVLYKAAGKGTLHRNTAARKVARLSRALYRKHGAAAKA
ncbi:MAG TPA: 30S ribosomal protein S20 [Candidatus Binataceae bacterium]|jgi:small subunit ribosomal protein S20|nr:30S ribosomal protein S20 [Candidatus Binataceae bacterium]